MYYYYLHQVIIYIIRMFILNKDSKAKKWPN